MDPYILSSTLALIDAFKAEEAPPPGNVAGLEGKGCL